MEGADSFRKLRLIWAVVLCIVFPLTILFPFVDAYLLRHISASASVPFELSNGLLSTSSILFGFTSLIIISKEWIDRKIWALLVPPLVMIVMAGVAIGDLALGTVNGVVVLLLCSGAFNASVVSTGFVVGYVTWKLPKRKAP